MSAAKSASGKASKPHDLGVVGGGVGGLVTASVAGQLGLDTVLIERGHNLGGDCLHYGCVPSKTLIRSASVARTVARSAEYGVHADGGQVDFTGVLQRVRRVVESIQEHDDPERFRGFGVDVRFGEARFTDPHTVAVDGAPVRGRRFVIATGSAPAVPPVPGLSEAEPLTNETVFSIDEQPERLAVIGAGSIGMEMAQAFQRLGTRVTVIEAAERILPRDDADAAEELRTVVAREGVDVRVGTALKSVRSRDGEHALELGDGGTVACDRILVAAGRRATLDALDLEKAGVETENGLIRVDPRMRTSRKHIFACGDCCGPYAFTHMAEYQAGIVLANAVFRFPKKASYRSVPWVTFTDPELGQVGLTEAQAREQGLSVDVARFRTRDVDRAMTDGQTDGFVKLIVHRGRLVGGTVLAPHGGELLHELVLAVHARVKVSALSAAIHAYPTLSQIHRRAVNTLYAPRLYSARTRRMVQWIHRLLP